MEYTVKTDVFESGLITQELHQKTEDQTEILCRWVVDTRDEELKKALVMLGWSPPKEDL